MSFYLNNVLINDGDDLYINGEKVENDIYLGQDLIYEFNTTGKPDLYEFIIETGSDDTTCRIEVTQEPDKDVSCQIVETGEIINGGGTHTFGNLKGSTRYTVRVSGYFSEVRVINLHTNTSTNVLDYSANIKIKSIKTWWRQNKTPSLQNADLDTDLVFSSKISNVDLHNAFVIEEATNAESKVRRYPNIGTNVKFILPAKIETLTAYPIGLYKEYPSSVVNGTLVTKKLNSPANAVAVTGCLMIGDVCISRSSYNDTEIIIPDNARYLPEKFASYVGAGTSDTEYIDNNITKFSFGNNKVLTSIPNNFFSGTGQNFAMDITFPANIVKFGQKCFTGITAGNLRFLQPAGTTLDIATDAFGASKSYAGVLNIYTENEAILNYDWSANYVTPTFYHLDGTPYPTATPATQSIALLDLYEDDTAIPVIQLFGDNAQDSIRASIMQRRRCAVWGVPDKPYVFVGRNNYNVQYCADNNITCLTFGNMGGAIVTNEGDFDIGYFDKAPNTFGDGFAKLLKEYLTNKSIACEWSNNDLLADGKYKVATYVSTPIDKTFVYTAFHISINVDLDLIKHICVKPMVKVPKGLGDYGVTTEEIKELFLKYANNFKR